MLCVISRPALCLLYVLLQVCADTIVGNQMLRGVSGGQRKRVTTGELMVGPAKTLFMVSLVLTVHSIMACIRVMLLYSI